MQTTVGGEDKDTVEHADDVRAALTSSDAASLGAPGPEHVDGARERISAHRLAHERGQPLRSLAEVPRFRRHRHPDRAGRLDHDAPFKAPITDVSLYFWSEKIGFSAGLAMNSETDGRSVVSI